MAPDKVTDPIKVYEPEDVPDVENPKVIAWKDIIKPRFLTDISFDVYSGLNIWAGITKLAAIGIDEAGLYNPNAFILEGKLGIAGGKAFISILDDELLFALNLTSGYGISITSVSTFISGALVDIEGPLKMETRELQLANLPASSEGSLTLGHGSMYYDTTNNRVRVNINGTWKTVTAA